MDSLILDHYHNPKHHGKLLAPTHHARTENHSCGDSLSIDIAVKDGIIEEVRWTGNGCALSQGSASLLSEHVQGKREENIRRFTKDEALTLLGVAAFSPARMRCALLALETLQQALRKDNQ